MDLKIVSGGHSQVDFAVETFLKFIYLQSPPAVSKACKTAVACDKPHYCIHEHLDCDGKQWQCPCQPCFDF